MASSRREVLVSGGVIGAAIVSANFSILDAFAGPTPPRRVSLEGLAWNDPVVETYRDGVDLMQKKPANDKFNWSKLAHIHGLDENNFNHCPHGNWYLLPWHRAYVVTYEKAIRQLTGNPGFAMPYWDWTKNPKMPDVFLSDTLPNNQPNPLFVSGAHARTWPSNTPMPDEIVGQDVYNQILGDTPFEVFGSTRPDNQNDTAQHWITDGSGAQGTLEATPHNNVHNNIGGWMPSALSPMDPIFFMHHSNIDRIWDVWNHEGNANSSDPLWTGMTFQNHFLNPDGSSWSPKVSDLQVPENLGYTYRLNLSAFNARNLVLIENKLAQLIRFLKNPGGPVEQGIKVTTLAGSQVRSAGGAQHLQFAANVDAGLVAKVRARAPRLRPSDKLSARQVADAAAPGTHAYVLLKDVLATAPKDAEFRVFLNAESPTPATPISDPHYVGTFGILRHAHEGHGEMPVSFMLDLTEAMRRVGDAKLNLQVVPVANRRGRDPGIVNARAAQLAFVTT